MISCTANDKRYTAYICTPADHGFTAELIVYVFCASQSRYYLDIFCCSSAATAYSKAFFASKYVHISF